MTLYEISIDGDYSESSYQRSTTPVPTIEYDEDRGCGYWIKRLFCCL